MTNVPPPCEPDIYESGKAVYVIQGPRMHTIEEFIKRVAAVSGERVDWHFVGGYAVVLTLGDVEKVQHVIKRQWHHLVDAYMKCDDNFVRPSREEHVRGRLP